MSQTSDLWKHISLDYLIEFTGVYTKMVCCKHLCSYFFMHNLIIKQLSDNETPSILM